MSVLKFRYFTLYLKLKNIQHVLSQVLRLICLQSAVNFGLKQKVLEYYKKAIIQTYGFQHLITLANLEKSGLIKQQVKKIFENVYVNRHETPCVMIITGELEELCKLSPIVETNR